MISVEKLENEKNIIHFITRLNEMGIFITIINEQLKLNAPKGLVTKPVLEEIKKRKNELLETLKRNNSDEEFISIKKAEQKDYYPLSSAQKRLFLLQQIDLQSTAYNMPYVIPLGFDINKEKIEKSFSQLILRHESLRTSFQTINENPLQKIHEKTEFKIQYSKIEHTRELSDKNKFIQPFDLSKAPLFRVFIIQTPSDGYFLFIDMHHIISDGVSHNIFEQEFHSLYSGEKLPPLKFQYKDYSEWLQSEEQQKKIKKQEEYWIKKFEGNIPVLNLPTDYSRPPLQSYEGASVGFVLSPNETNTIKTLAKENGMTLYMTLLSSFAILLTKLSADEDIVIGTPVAGREHVDLEKIVGMFVNTLAIKLQIDKNQSLRKFFGQVKTTTLEAFENQACQFEDLVDKVSAKRDISRNPIFDVMFDIINQENNPVDLSAFTSGKYIHQPGMAKFDFSLSVIDYGKQIFCSFEYCTKLFLPQTIERTIHHFKQILSQLKTNLDKPISSLQIISELEKQKILNQFNNRENNFPTHKSIHQLFSEQAEKTPGNIAVAFENKKISYKSLDEKSNQLAHYLKNKTTEKDTFIGICLNSSIEQYISILAILKCGLAYLPLDTALPVNRMKYMIQDSGTKIILSDNDKLDSLGIDIDSLNVKLIDYGNESKEPVKTNFSSNSLAYTIYTSGSTGKPKGVMVKHSGVINTIYSQKNSYNISPEDKIIQFSSLSFDASVEQYGITLLSGATLYIISKDNLLDYEYIKQFIKKHKITHLDAVPSYLSGLEIYDLPSLKRVVSGGENCSVDLINKMSGKDFYNAYGPTETSITATCYKIKGDEASKGFIPIGKPLDNTQAYILDENLNLQAIGIPGELCISGAGLTFGYLNNHELTSEKFIQHPFKKDELLYKTGDLARWLIDGNIQYLGRIGKQVKIRGFRIELGEIENMLVQHHKIDECIVTEKKENDTHYLCAYIVSKENPGEEEIRDFLSENLPGYMIPAYFIKIDRFPLTTSGKIDLEKLPYPQLKINENYIAPSNKTEEKLAEIWSEILNIKKEKISTNANFFNLGGHSLKASVCINKLRTILKADIPLIEIFKNPTIHKLATIINKTKQAKTLNDANLVLLKQGNRQSPNIFFIHDGSGEIDGYIELCKQANDHINYWGIKAGDLKKTEAYSITISQIAEKYIQCIKKVQDAGDYNIAGWSLGGPIALEMARLLEKENKNVKFLGIIDSVAPEFSTEHNHKFSIEYELKWLSNYFSKEDIQQGFQHIQTNQQLWLNIIHYLKSFNADKTFIKAEIIKNAGFEIAGFENQSIEELIKTMNFARSLASACQHYSPANKINTQIHYFAAKDSHNIDENKWRKLSNKDLVITSIEGNHFSIFKQPLIKAFYKEFNKSFSKMLKLEESLSEI